MPHAEAGDALSLSTSGDRLSLGARSPDLPRLCARWPMRLDGDGLAEVIVRDPRGTLGDACLRRFGPRLPFGVRLITVKRPQPIVVHPDLERAALGFAREQRDGVPLDSPDRVYVDPHARPEMLYAITRFDALAGLRRPRRVAYLVDLLDVRRLRPVQSLLADATDAVAALELLASWPVAERTRLVADVVAGVRAALASPEQLADDPDAVAALEWVFALAAHHPDDPLVVGPLILELARLQPGATFFLPPGVPVGYLSGVGVQVAAASDNAVPIGLAGSGGIGEFYGRRVDPGAVVEVLDSTARPLFDVLPVRDGQPSDGQPRDGLTDGGLVHRLGPHEWAARPPGAPFQLARIVVGRVGAPDVVSVSAQIGGPQVLLCSSGDVEVSVGEHSVRLRAGDSAFIGAEAVMPGLARGSGEIFRAALGAGF